METISVYFHDGNLEREVNWDCERKEFTWVINRIFYEKPKIGRFLFLIRKWKYRSMPTIMRFSPTTKVKDARKRLAELKN